MSTIITGKENLNMYRLIVLKSALRLECLGMKNSRGSVYSLIKKEFKLKGNKESVLIQFTQYIDSLKGTDK
jgi:hypothetical protein